MKRFYITLLLSVFLTTSCKSDNTGFDQKNYQNTTIFYQNEITMKTVNKISQDFNIGYKIVSNDLEASRKKARIYIYNSLDNLFNDLVEKWKYSKDWIMKNRVIPRMNKDYILWCFPESDIKYITHEYSHRIIEQIAGENSQIKYKWFDEGLAEYEGLKALDSVFHLKSENIKLGYLDDIYKAFNNKELIPLEDMITEEQWTKLGIGQHSGLNYIQSYFYVDYLIEKYGQENVKKLLKNFRKYNDFDKAFETTYNIAIKDFENKINEYLAAEIVRNDGSNINLLLKFADDPQDWNQYQPVYEDKEVNREYEKESYIRKIFTAIHDNSLYLMFNTDSLENKGNNYNYCFLIDNNNDNNPDYQIGFSNNSAWLWLLKEGIQESYKHQANFTKLYKYKTFIGRNIKFMMPLEGIGNDLRIKVYTSPVLPNGKSSNKIQDWINVK